MSSIDDFKYNFDVGARSNRYDVNFFLPKKLFGTEKTKVSFDESKKTEDNPEGKVKETVTKHGRFMGLRVESCSLPGRTIGTTSWSAQGQKRKMPDGTVDDGGEVDFTFICCLLYTSPSPRDRG